MLVMDLEFEFECTVRPTPFGVIHHNAVGTEGTEQYSVHT